MKNEEIISSLINARICDASEVRGASLEINGWPANSHIGLNRS
jgi:hypothetical protein